MILLSIRSATTLKERQQQLKKKQLKKNKQRSKLNIFNNPPDQQKLYKKGK